MKQVACSAMEKNDTTKVNKIVILWYYTAAVHPVKK